MISIAGDARADVGPAPSCPKGTHSAYLMGRRCVRDGYRLQQDAQGNVEEVADAPVASPNPVSAPAVVEPSQPAEPSKPAEPVKTGKAGGCAMSARSDGGASLGAAFAALALLLVGRRRRAPVVS